MQPVFLCMQTGVSSSGSNVTAHMRKVPEVPEDDGAACLTQRDSKIK